MMKVTKACYFCVGMGTVECHFGYRYRVAASFLFQIMTVIFQVKCNFKKPKNLSHHQTLKSVV